MLKEVEKQIVAQLTPLEDKGLQILNSPNGGRSAKPTARALVFFAGESSDPPTGRMAPLSQTSTLRWAINLEMIDLRSHHTAYPLIEALSEKLMGFRPSVGRFGGMYHVSTDYVALEGGAWVYSMSFAVTKFSV